MRGGGVCHQPHCGGTLLSARTARRVRLANRDLPKIPQLIDGRFTSQFTSLRGSKACHLTVLDIDDLIADFTLATPSHVQVCLQCLPAASGEPHLTSPHHLQDWPIDDRQRTETSQRNAHIPFRDAKLSTPRPNKQATLSPSHPTACHRLSTRRNFHVLEVVTHVLAVVSQVTTSPGVMSALRNEYCTATSFPAAFTTTNVSFPKDLFKSTESGNGCGTNSPPCVPTPA